MVSFFNKTTYGVVGNLHSAGNLRLGDVVRVEWDEKDPTHVTKVQRFEGGLFGALSCAQRIGLVEAGKGEALAASADALIPNLSILLHAASDTGLDKLFIPHIALMELFLRDPEAVKRLQRTEDPRKIRRMLERCLTLRDITKRPNPHSKVPGVLGSIKRLGNMSARRLATSKRALAESVTLGALLQAIHTLISRIYAQVRSVLYANIWDVENPRNKRRFKTLAFELRAFARECESIDMHPLNASAKTIAKSLNLAATKLEFKVVRRNNVAEVKTHFESIIRLCFRLLIRFNVGDMQRIVGTANDARVQRLGLAIKAPDWARIAEGVLQTRTVITTSLDLEDPEFTSDADRLRFYYTALRTIANNFDRNARTPDYLLS